MEETNITNESHMDKHGHKYWALILVLMGLCLASVMYFVYKNTITEYLQTPPTMVEKRNEVEPTPESTETSGSVEEDQSKPTPQVTDDVLKEIEDVQNTDASATFETSQMSDLE